MVGFDTACPVALNMLVFPNFTLQLHLHNMMYTCSEEAMQWKAAWRSSTDGEWGTVCNDYVGLEEML